MPRKKLSVFEEARNNIGTVIDSLITYRNKEGKDVNAAAITFLKDAIELMKKAEQRISCFEKFLYYAGKGDRLFFVNNETGEIERGSIEKILKTTRDLKGVLQ